MTFEL